MNEKKKHNENEAITEINKDTMKTKRDGMCNQFYLPILFLLDTFLPPFIRWQNDGNYSRESKICGIRVMNGLMAKKNKNKL